ncbi:hypothetical protein [Empedobacter sp. ULE_I140]
MKKDQFLQKLSNINEATSVTGVKYRDIKITGTNIQFIREKKSKPESISIDELYEFHSSGMPINTVVARSYISGRVQSPSVAILNELNQVPVVRYPNGDSTPTIRIANDPKKSGPDDKIKDETRFFQVFSEVIGPNFLLSKSVGRPITSSHIFLSNNFKEYDFSPSIISCYSNLLKDLKSDNLFSSESLSHFLDGLTLNHPIIGTRIIEFDEEQHFTPARMDTLKRLSGIVQTPYIDSYMDICSDIKYLQTEVFKKHRLKSKIQQVPKTFSEFTDWLINSNEKSSGYICEKNGFEFSGGRIAQRAYYDSLRDTAHFSPKNPNMKTPLRFPKKEFEDIAKCQFSKIPLPTIKNILIRILSEKYSINLSSA